MKPLKVVAVAAAAAVVMSVATCTGPALPFATYDRGPSEGGAYEMPAAGLSGALVMVDGCLYVLTPERWLPVFPAGTKWDPDSRSLQIPPWSGRVSVGEQVDLVGGEVRFSPDLFTLPGTCEPPDRAKVWLVGMLGERQDLAAATAG